MTKSFLSYRELETAGFPLSAFKDTVFMPIAGAIQPEPQPEAKFQLSLIKGGVLLSVCLYHHLTDGNGMNTITRALGDECRRAAEIEGDLPPRVLNTDRSVMASLDGGKTDIADHPANSIMKDIYLPGARHDEVPPEVNGEPAPQSPPRFVPAYYHLDHESAHALKHYCSRDIPVSTHDSISALLWRNLTQARVTSGELKEDTLCTFSGPHNSRKHVGLPNDWIGNCVYFYAAQTTAADIIKEDSLPDLAAKIRGALNKVDREHMEGISTIRKKDPYSLAWWPVNEFDQPHIVAITSFYHSELLGTDFGAALGTVRHFTSTDMGAFGSTFQRAHFVGPKLLGGRGADVHVGLLEGEVEHFHNDPLWRKYLTLRELPNAATGA
ncbi:hypothetical protein DOTSEDRAFT_71019 [Dothistroma septosporum NZE10]|uniref:Trichothecene 3-O-acetyltransferase-like N-terminal domain-containing protein n=1 Tax=Dothistroma septosporum (strain NZE10 / CBS 128990) TaxID=675120 RepID=N1PP40_DOTSN|nr:hypothetical protein DOTSEDRAFT_71019 [Dothistroma septosporum NZE10]